MPQSTHSANWAYMNQVINQTVDKRISFRAYMELCLYDPEVGYYRRNTKKIGKAGDYYTSASLGEVMGASIARYLLGMIRDADWPRGPITIAEWGGGSGRLAVAVCNELKSAAPEVYSRLNWISVEQDPYASMEAQQAMSEAGHGDILEQMDAAQWSRSAPFTQTCIISNELLDAFAVHRLVRRSSGWREIYVRTDEINGSLKELEVEYVNPQALAWIESNLAMTKLAIPEGQRVEVNISADNWLQHIASSLHEGFVLTIDYGDLSDELYSAHRYNGTLLCYSNHRADDRPYDQPGEVDITAHVNFGSLIAAGQQAGLLHKFYGTQKQFLLNAGILDMLQEHHQPDPFHPAAKRNRAIRQLLLSDQMSELFKVLVQQKNRSNPIDLQS